MSTPPAILVTPSSRGSTASVLLGAGLARPAIASAVGHAPRWLSAAGTTSVGTFRLGEQGWVRFSLPDADYRLDEVYLPSETVEGAPLLVLPGQAQRDGPAALWLYCMHPHTAFRIRSSRDPPTLMAEALTAIQARYTIDLRPSRASPTYCLAHTDSVIAAQLLWLAGRRLCAAAEEAETVSPWEDDIVQAAAQLGLGPPAGDRLTIEIDDPHELSPRLGERLVELLDSQIVTHQGEQPVE